MNIYRALLDCASFFLLCENYVSVTIDIGAIPQNTVTYAPIPASVFTRAEAMDGTDEEHCTTIISLECASYDVHLSKSF